MSDSGSIDQKSSTNEPTAPIKDPQSFSSFNTPLKKSKAAEGIRRSPKAGAHRQKYK